MSSPFGFFPPAPNDYTSGQVGYPPAPSTATSAEGARAYLQGLEHVEHLVAA